ncbi:MAG: hypothetical protein AAF824_16330 [Bacteroidota bacterium]
MKSILAINGHPDPDSYNYALSASYIKGLQQGGFTASPINITELSFSPSLPHSIGNYLPWSLTWKNR